MIKQGFEQCVQVLRETPIENLVARTIEVHFHVSEIIEKNDLEQLTESKSRLTHFCPQLLLNPNNTQLYVS